MKASTFASMILTFGMLVACGGAVSLGQNGGQLQKGAKCTTCSGAAPADAKQCADGTAIGRDCLSNGDGTCGYEFPACPGDLCQASECTGPGLGAPNFVCPDGSTGGPVCSRNKNGICGWNIRQCPAIDAGSPDAR